MAKLKGSTLPESLVAMTVLVTCFAVTFLMIGTVMNSDKTMLKFRAKLAIEQIADETRTDQIFLDDKIDSLDFMVIKKFIPYRKSKNLILFSLEAFPIGSERAVYSRKEIIRID